MESKPDFYATARENRGKKARSSWLPVFLTAALAVAILTVLAIWFGGGRPRFYRFVASLSRSTSLVYENNDLRARVEGEELRITVENAYGLYSYIAANGQGMQWLFPPGEEPELELTYGDGAQLQVWANEAGNAIIHFEGADGVKYTYSSKMVNVESMRLRYLSEKQNPGWEE